VRLFTAIELPEEVRAAVHAAAAPLLRGLPGCKPVAEENLHVTVKFLGEVAEDRLAEIAAAVRQAASTGPAARLRILGFGAFPDPRRPRVVWAGVEDAARSLPILERAVTGALEPLGFRPEDRAWTAHVTVARLGDPRRRRGGVSGLVVPAPAPTGPPFDATHLTLFASELGPRGPTYRVVERFPLAMHGRDPEVTSPDESDSASRDRPPPAASGRDSGLPRRESPHERQPPGSSVRPGPDSEPSPPPPDRPPPP